MWPLIYPRLLELILAHRTTIVFVNSRRLAERVSQQLTELAVATGVAPEGVELVRAHHGSVARHQRQEIEEALKAGRLRAITATSSLELGIDMGTVDLVVQVESPGAVSRGLQRIGRASHHVGGTSRGRIIPKFRGDLLEATVVAHEMLEGEVEPIRVPDSALDVLAQQIVAMVAADPWPVAELERVIRRAASYRELSRAALTGVLDMLAGRYPSRRVRRASPAPDLGSPERRARRPQGRAPAQRGLGRHDPGSRHLRRARRRSAARASASSTRRWSPRAARARRSSSVRRRGGSRTSRATA